MNSFEDTWSRIERLAGAEFQTKRGVAFSYDCDGSAVHLRNTTRSLPKGQFRQALDRFPVPGPGALQDLQGPSYIHAILTDPRVAQATSSSRG